MLEDNELKLRIQQVQDMGFEYQDALSALEVNNYNISQAVDYLFMNYDAQAAVREARQREDENLRQLTEDAEKPPPPTQGHVNIQPGILNNIELPIEYQEVQPESFQINEPVNLDKYRPQPPPLPQRTWSSHHIENATPHYTTPDSNSTTYAQPTSISNEYMVAEEAPYSIYQDVERYKRKDHAPAVLMPLRNGQYEGYINALLTMLYEISEFKKNIYRHKFDTLGFHPRWFQGHDISIPPTTSIVNDQEGKEHDLKFLLETQRLFAFLSGESERAFASSKNFINSFPRPAQQKLGEVESLSEAYDVFYHTLVEELRIVGVEDGGLGFFENTFSQKGDESTPDNVSKIGMLAIDSDDWSGSIHKSLTSLLCQHQNDGSIAYIEQLSDLLTVSIDPVFGSTMSSIELEEEFYPQIYTPGFFDIIDEVTKKRKDALGELAKNNQILVNLKQHQGKQVGPAIDSTIQFIQTQIQGAFSKDGNSSLEHTHEVLCKAKETTQNLKEQLMQRNEVLSEDIKKYDVNNVRTLLDLYSKDVEPYILIGLIFNQDQFAYIKRVEGELIWVSVKHESRIITNFNIRPVEFEELKEKVKAVSNNTPMFEQSLVMVYVKKSLLDADSDGINVPKSVLDFIEKDREELEKTLELLGSDTDPELMEFEDAGEEGNFDQVRTESREVSDESDTSSADLIDLDSPGVNRTLDPKACPSLNAGGSADAGTLPSSIPAIPGDGGRTSANGASSPMSIDEVVSSSGDFSPTISTTDSEPKKNA